MQPLLNVKYDTITIINDSLTPWWDVASQSSSDAGKGESPLLQEKEPPPPLQEMKSLPLLPWHTSNIITFAN